MARQLQRVDRGIATHETNECTLDIGIESAALHQLQVDAGREKSRAAGNDQMGDAAAVLARQQPFRRFGRKTRREILEQLHARAGAGKGAGPIEMRGVAFALRLEKWNSGAKCPSVPPCG